MNIVHILPNLHKKKVLLIDFDPQGYAVFILGNNIEEDENVIGMHRVLIDGADIISAIINIGISDLDMVSQPDHDTKLWLMWLPARELLLSNALEDIR